jgi:ribosome-binding ATPase YchF (GTP1/OBG family)
MADLAIVGGRIERLHQSLKKPRPDRDQLRHELDLLTPVHQALEAGTPLCQLQLTPEQQQATRSFQLFAEKPRLVVVNVAEDEPDPQQFASLAPPGSCCIAVSLALQLELHRMDPAERAEFCREMNVTAYDRGSLIRSIVAAARQIVFFTVSAKEVRTWMIPSGGAALEAAGAVHTDLARGFIRAEVMNCDDLIRLGGEREVKAHNLMRQEPKSYVVQDGDVLYVRHN